MKAQVLKMIPTFILLTALTAFTPIAEKLTYAAAQHIAAPSPHALHIVFDFGGVLGTTDIKSIVDTLGLFKILKYKATTGNSPRDLQMLLFNLLAQIESDGNSAHACDPDGNPLPGALCDWQRGTQSSEQICQQVCTLIKENKKSFANTTEYLLLERLARIMFTPESLANAQHVIPDAVKLVQECIDNGHEVYILSNYDSATFGIIYKNPKFKNLFKLFKPENILVSSTLGCMKPEKEIYLQFHRQFPHVNPNTVVFIDDQKENIEAARNIGWHGIVCPAKKGFFNIFKQPDITAVRTQLNEIEQYKIPADAALHVH